MFRLENLKLTDLLQWPLPGFPHGFLLKMSGAMEFIHELLKNFPCAFPDTKP